MLYVYSIAQYTLYCTFVLKHNNVNFLNYAIRILKCTVAMTYRVVNNNCVAQPTLIDILIVMILHVAPQLASVLPNSNLLPGLFPRGAPHTTR